MHPFWLLLLLRWLLLKLLLLLTSISTVWLWDLWSGPGWVVPSHPCGRLLVDDFLKIVSESLLSRSWPAKFREPKPERGSGSPSNERQQREESSGQD